MLETEHEAAGGEVAAPTPPSRGITLLTGAVLGACALLIANLVAILCRDTLSLRELDEYQRGLVLRTQAYSEDMISGGAGVLVLFRGEAVRADPGGIKTLRSGAEQIIKSLPRDMESWRHEILECSDRSGGGFSIHALALKGET